MLRSPRCLLIAASAAILTALALAADRLTLIPLPFQWGNQRVLVRSNGGFLMNGNPSGVGLARRLSATMRLLLHRVGGNAAPTGPGDCLFLRERSPMAIGILGSSGARVLFVTLLACAFAAIPLAPSARADGPAAGTDRLLITEMAAIKASAGKLSSALEQADFETANGQLAAIKGNWAAVRSELERRDSTEIVAGFESAMSRVSTAVEAGDQEAASANAGQLTEALGAVNKSLESADFNGGRIVTALLLPLLLIAALTLALPAITRKAGVKL